MIIFHFLACTEAYTVLTDTLSCRLGCVFMAKHRGVPVNSVFAITMRLDDGQSSPNLLVLPADIPENDIFNEAGLGKEFLPGWWDNDGFKLPETYFKTVPIDSGVSLFKDYIYYYIFTTSYIYNNYNIIILDCRL